MQERTDRPKDRTKTQCVLQRRSNGGLAVYRLLTNNTQDYNAAQHSMLVVHAQLKNHVKLYKKYVKNEVVNMLST